MRAPMSASDQNKESGALASVASHPVVAELYAAWIAREQKLDQHKAKVKLAVAAFADGTGPDPSRMITELAEMREDCNSVCYSLVTAVRRAKGQL